MKEDIDKIIRYMKIKSTKIEKDLGIKDYFTEDDEKDLRGKEDKLQGCWEAIKYNDHKNNYSGCPYCFIYKEEDNLNCAECGYGTRHGICAYTTDNIWVKIIKKFKVNFNCKNFIGLRWKEFCDHCMKEAEGVKQKKQLKEFLDSI